MVAVPFTASSRGSAAIRIGGLARDRRIVRRGAATFVAGELVHGLRLSAVLVAAAGTAETLGTQVLFGILGHERLLG